MKNREILESKPGKIRWECEHCSTPISCNVANAGAESQCPHCGNSTIFPTLEEMPEKKIGAIRKSADLIGSFGLAYIFSVMSHVSTQKDQLFFSSTDRIIQFLSGALGITIRYALISWIICVIIAKMRKKAPPDGKTFPWRKFSTIWIVLCLADYLILGYLQPPISSSHDALDHLTQKANS